MNDKRPVVLGVRCEVQKLVLVDEWRMLTENFGGNPVLRQDVLRRGAARFGTPAKHASCVGVVSLDDYYDFIVNCVRDWNARVLLEDEVDLLRELDAEVSVLERFRQHLRGELDALAEGEGDPPYRPYVELHPADKDGVR